MIKIRVKTEAGSPKDHYLPDCAAKGWFINERGELRVNLRGTDGGYPAEYIPDLEAYLNAKNEREAA